MSDPTAALSSETISIEAEEHQSITRGAFTQVIYTLLSRFFGLIREIMTSHFFGATAVTDAFLVAFTIPNVLRSFLGEGALGVAMVPIYTDVKEKQGLPSAQRFFSYAFGLLLVFLMAVVCLGLVFAEPLVHLFAYGFKTQEQVDLTVSLTRWMFPYVAFICVVSLLGALLQCHRQFAAFSATPILLNVAMIACMWGFFSFMDAPIYSLVWGVLLGGLAQYSLMFWAVKKSGLWVWPRLSLSTPAVQDLIKLLTPALFGIAVYQLNIVILRQLGSFLPAGQLSCYYYADRLLQFALGVFAISIATAALPALSQRVATEGHDTMMKTIRFSLMLSSFIAIPSAVGLFILAEPIVSVLFFHGEFLAQDVHLTALTLMAFAPSLVPVSLMRPVVQGFYTLRNTKIPVLVGAGTVIANLVFGLLLLPMQVPGLGLALSISSHLQVLALWFILKRRVNLTHSLGMGRTMARQLGLALGMGFIAYALSLLGDWSEGPSLFNMMVLSLAVGMGGVFYLGAAWVIKLPEALTLARGLSSYFGNRRFFK